MKNVTKIHVESGYLKPIDRGLDAYTPRLLAEIDDLTKALAGDPTSKTWQELNVKLTNKKTQLRARKEKVLHDVGHKTVDA